MSVKLSELKAPPAATEIRASSIECALERKRINPADDYAWLDNCALAALYWLREGQEQTLGPKRAELEKLGHGLAAREMFYDGYEQDCRDQADLWQRAAFEGVEP